MSRIEFRGDFEEVVRAALQVATNRAMYAPENAAKLVSEVVSQL